MKIGANIYIYKLSQNWKSRYTETQQILLSVNIILHFGKYDVFFHHISKELLQVYGDITARCYRELIYSSLLHQHDQSFTFSTVSWFFAWQIRLFCLLLVWLISNKTIHIRNHQDWMPIKMVYIYLDLLWEVPPLESSVTGSEWTEPCFTISSIFQGPSCPCKRRIQVFVFVCICETWPIQ